MSQVEGSVVKRVMGGGKGTETYYALKEDLLNMFQELDIKEFDEINDTQRYTDKKRAVNRVWRQIFDLLYDYEYEKIMEIAYEDKTVR